MNVDVQGQRWLPFEHDRTADRSQVNNAIGPVSVDDGDDVGPVIDVALHKGDALAYRFEQPLGFWTRWLYVETDHGVTVLGQQAQNIAADEASATRYKNLVTQLRSSFFSIDAQDTIRLQ